MMNCIRAKKDMIPYIHGELSKDRKTALLHHVAGCDYCRQELAYEQLLQDSLSSLPVPPPRAGFFDQILADLEPKSQVAMYKQPWFAGALAATLAICLTLGIMNFNTNRVSDIAQIQLAVEEVKMVRLKFNAPRDFQKVTLTLELPDHFELKGFPGQKKVAWETTLDKGINVLQLPVVARQAIDGVLVAHINGNGKTKAFKVLLKAEHKREALLPAVRGV